MAAPSASCARLRTRRARLPHPAAMLRAAAPPPPAPCAPLRRRRAPLRAPPAAALPAAASPPAALHPASEELRCVQLRAPFLRFSVSASHRAPPLTSLRASPRHSAFVERSTGVRALALLPELPLRLARCGGILELWAATEAALAPGCVLDPPYWYVLQALRALALCMRALTTRTCGCVLASLVR